MLDNLNKGSGVSDIVEQMKSARTANEPERTEHSEPTGGTEEVELETSHEQESEVVATNDESSDVYEDTEGNEQESETQTWTVKANGQERKLNDDEMHEYASKGIDYTQKTMAHAESVKEVEAKQAEVNAKLNELESLIKSSDDEIDWDELKDSDPREYIRLEKLQEERKEVLSKARAKQQEEFEANKKVFINKESSELIVSMGGDKWTNEQRTKDFESANVYLESLGVTEAERVELIDHRLWRMVFDATKYKALMKTKGRVSKEVKDAPKSVKPGQRNAPSQTAIEDARSGLKRAGKANELEATVALLKTKRKQR